MLSDLQTTCWQDERWNTQHGSSWLLGSPGGCPVCSRFGCHLKTHKAYSRRHRLRYPGQRKYTEVHQIGAGKFNPFAQHPIEMTPDLEKLYSQGWSQWNSDFNGPERHLFPIPRYSAIFREAFHDIALHYGILSVVATQVSMLRNGQADELALYLQGQVIAAQRAALAGGELSDARVMTALCIMSNAYSMNKVNDLSLHWQLISAWVQHRGGLVYLGMDGVIADDLMYADTLSAVVHNVTPEYPVQTPPLASFTAPEAGAAYAELQLSRLLQDDVVSVASHYLVLVRIFDRVAQGIYRSSEATYFRYLANVVEYELACANKQYHDTDTLEECIILSILLSNNSLLRNYGQLAPHVSVFENRFWRCLDELRRKDHFGVAGLRELECYLVCVGTITSVRRPSPYEDKVINMLADLRRGGPGCVQEFDHFCCVMNRYGWSQSACLKLYTRVWNASLSLIDMEHGR